MIASPDHDEQVARIGAVLRSRRQGGDVGEDAVAGPDIGIAPCRRHGRGLIQVIDRAGDLRVVQHV